MKRILTLALTLTLTFTLACNQENDNDKINTLVYPDQTTSNFDQNSLSFATSIVEDTCNDPPCPELFTEPKVLCGFAAHAGSIAIIEHTAKPEVFTLDYPACDGPYASWGQTFEGNVLAVVAGEPLPEHINIVGIHRSLFGNYPLIGDMRIVSVREVDGEWFLGAELSMYEGEHPPQGLKKVQLPSSLDELRTKLTFTVENFTSECNLLGVNRLADEEWERFNLDPYYWGEPTSRCFEPGAPPAEPEPPDERCTDDFPCDP